MARLLSNRATVVSHGGRWWPADVFRLDDGTCVAVSSSDVCRVYPGAGCWWYGGRADPVATAAAVRNPFDCHPGPAAPGGEP